MTKPVYYRLTRYEALYPKPKPHPCGADCIDRDCLIRSAMHEMKEMFDLNRQREAREGIYE